ncbi:MAG: HD domain-containing phosphohydrolase [Sterolibacterium sp.]
MDVAARILVVDDEPANRLILEDMLSDHFAVQALGSGREALDYLMAGAAVDLILLDVVMPGMDGFEVCRRIKATPRLSDVPVLFLTSLDSAAGEERGLSLGAEDFIHKPFSPPVVLARMRNHLELFHSRRRLRDRNADLERMVADRTREILRQSEELMHREKQVIAAQSATITAFCALAEARDNETGNHIRRTQRYVEALARKLSSHPRFAAELDEDTIQLLFKSAPLHDVGKVAIPDRILLKPGKLDPEEWAIMQRHSEYGYAAIAQASADFGEAAGFLRFASEIAHSHHEKWDGSGYPQKLAGEAIPLSARLMAVADVYDALISRRVYKPAYPHAQAMALIAEGRGTHFDPDIADAVCAIAGEFQMIATSYRDEDQENQP